MTRAAFRPSSSGRFAPIHRRTNGLQDGNRRRAALGASASNRCGQPAERISSWSHKLDLVFRSLRVAPVDGVGIDLKDRRQRRSCAAPIPLVSGSTAPSSNHLRRRVRAGLERAIRLRPEVRGARGRSRGIAERIERAMARGWRLLASKGRERRRGLATAALSCVARAPERFVTEKLRDCLALCVARSPTGSFAPAFRPAAAHRVGTADVAARLLEIGRRSSHAMTRDFPSWSAFRKPSALPWRHAAGNARAWRGRIRRRRISRNDRGAPEEGAHLASKDHGSLRCIHSMMRRRPLIFPLQL